MNSPLVFVCIFDEAISFFITLPSVRSFFLEKLIIFITIPIKKFKMIRLLLCDSVLNKLSNQSAGLKKMVEFNQETKILAREAKAPAIYLFPSAI